MLLEIGILSIVLGVLVMVLGAVIWGKQKYTYASRNKDVKKQDIKPFSKLIGQATLCFGAAIACEGVFFVLSLPLWGILGLMVYNGFIVQGVRTPGLMVTLPFLVVLAGWLTGLRNAIIFGVVGIISILLMWGGEAAGWLHRAG